MIKGVYVSYSWREESEEIVDMLVQALEKKNIIITRDKTSLGYKGNIKQFMSDLGHSKHVIIIISKSYLQSINCMYELLTIYSSGDFEERIYPIILSDAKIYELTDRIDYIDYWEEKTKKVEDYVKKLSLKSTYTLGDEYKVYLEVSSNISEITQIIESMNSLTPKMHKDADFDDIARAIITQNNTTIDTPTTPEELKKFTQQGVMESTIEISLYEWLIKNEKVLFKKTFDDFLSRKEVYLRLVLNDLDSMNKFKASIKEHIKWLINMVKMLDPDISIRRYVRETELIYKIPLAYSDFFIIMRNLIRTNRVFNDLDEEESNILLGYIDFIVETLE